MKNILFLLAAFLVLSVYSAPKIQFIKEELSLGELLQGDVKEFEFEVANVGDKTLEITEVRPTCGCTSTGKTKFTLKPGEKGTIPFKFNTGRFAGAQHKAVTVVSNDPERGSVSLQFTANISSLLELKPDYFTFQFDNSPIGLAAPQLLTITNRYSSPLVSLVLAPIDLKLTTSPKSPMNKLRLAKDSSMTVEISPALTAPLPETKYGQLTVVMEFADGKKMDKQLGVSFRK